MRSGFKLLTLKRFAEDCFENHRWIQERKLLVLAKWCKQQKVHRPVVFPLITLRSLVEFSATTIWNWHDRFYSRRCLDLIEFWSFWWARTWEAQLLLTFSTSRFNGNKYLERFAKFFTLSSWTLTLTWTFWLDHHSEWFASMDLASLCFRRW